MLNEKDSVINLNAAGSGFFLPWRTFGSKYLFTKSIVDVISCSLVFGPIVATFPNFIRIILD